MSREACEAFAIKAVSLAMARDGARAPCAARRRAGAPPRSESEVAESEAAVGRLCAGSSGGVVRLVTIDSTGVTRRMVPGNEVPVGYDELKGLPLRPLAAA